MVTRALPYSHAILIPLGNFAVLMARLNQRESNYQEKLHELHYKLEKNNITPNLRKKVIEYFEYTWRKNETFKSLSDFSSLSESLQKDLLFEMYRDFIIKCPIFIELDQAQIYSLVLKLQYALNY